MNTFEWAMFLVGVAVCGLLAGAVAVYVWHAVFSAPRELARLRGKMIGLRYKIPDIESTIRNSLVVDSTGNYTVRDGYSTTIHVALQRLNALSIEVKNHD